jgi:hypothetical protein
MIRNYLSGYQTIHLYETLSKEYLQWMKPQTPQPLASSRPLVKRESGVVSLATPTLSNTVFTPTHFIVSIAAPCVPVIAALMCTTKRRVEGVRILDFMELQKVK